MLFIFRKNERDNLSQEQIQALRRICVTVTAKASAFIPDHASTRTPARPLPMLPPLPDRASQLDDALLSAR